VVVAALLALFLVPREFFIPLTFGATSFMIVVAYFGGTFKRERSPRGRQVLIGVSSAAVLYAIFYFGALFVKVAQPLGISPGAESSIYSLISSPANPLFLQVGVLLFDSVGYESYFRGTLLKGLQTRYSFWGVFAVAFFDALLHLAALYRYPGIAPLWSATTFIADSVWGLTYYYSRSLLSSFTSHFVWDVTIFLVAPIS